MRVLSRVPARPAFRVFLRFTPPPLVYLDLVFPVFFGAPQVAPDVACVARSHFGALPPARGAPQVPPVVAWLYPIHSLMPFLHIRCCPDVACVARSHFGAFPPARGAPEVPPDVFLIYQMHASMLHLQLGTNFWLSGLPNCTILIKGLISGSSRTAPEPFGLPNG